MKIFIAGATGTLGLPLVRELVARGHKVVGLTRSAAKRRVLEQLGAEAAIADALDETGLAEAVRNAGPEIVVHLLTAIPSSGPRTPVDMTATNSLRTKGTANLLRAAIAAGAKRFIAESMILVYGYGDHGGSFKKEEESLQSAGPAGGTKATVDALRSLEDQVMSAARKEEIGGTILRFGILYGPDVPAMESNLRMLQTRKLPVVRRGAGTLSFVHVHDAVSAIIAAIEGDRSGESYNIVDNEPVSYTDFLLSAAEITGAPHPRSVPLWFLRLTAPYAAAFLATRLNVSNEKAKRELGWFPQYPNYREGLKALAAGAGHEEKAA